MKNLLLTISVSTLLLVGQSAMAANESDQVEIPVFSNTVSEQDNVQVDKKVTYPTSSYREVNPYYNAAEDPFSLEYSSDK